MNPSADALRAGLRCGAARCACARGRHVHCPSHAPDQHPSLAVAERDGRVLVVCRSGCRQREVIAALRERGLWPGADSTRAARPQSVAEIALDLARNQGWARPGVLGLYRAADLVRARKRDAARIRTAATLAGDQPETWKTLDRAAQLDREALVVEAMLDELSAMGGLA